MNLATLIAGETISLFIPLILLPLFIFIFIKRSSSKRPPLPPGPYAWPIVGNIFQIGKNPHVALAKLAEVHGSLMSIRLGTRVLIIASSPMAAAEILKTHDRVLSGRTVSRPLQVKGSKLHNLALFFTDECDDGWRNLRNIYRSELFSAKALESHAKLRENKVNKMVKYLGSKEGEIVKIKDILFVTALNILSNTFLSVDFVDFEGNGVGGRMMECTRRLAEFAAAQLLTDLYPVLGWWNSQKWFQKSMDMIDQIWAAWVDVLNERRNGSTQLSGQRDFTDALIGKGFTDQQINPLFQELFSGGTETTTSAIEWVLAELIRNQEAMQKLHDEVATVIGEDMVRESNLPHLPYLQACIKETLRLHPSGPLLLPHRAVQSCEVMGHTIPKDSEMLVNVWAIARDPTIWDDPLSFKPERFLGSEVDYKGQDFQFLPFGSGRRMCPGQPLASKTVPLIVASLIHNFEWFLPNNMDPSEMDMADELDMAMHKKEQLHVILKLREQFKR